MAKTRKPQQSRSKQTVASIVEAGFIAVAREGMEGLTTRKVASIAGVSVGTLYEYFSNKEEILSAMNAQLAADVVSMIRPMVADLVTRPPREVVLTLLIGLRELLSRNDNRYLHYAARVENQYSEQELEPVRRVLADLAMQYLTRNPEYARVPGIQAKAYIMIHGGIATLIQQLSEEDAIVSFEELAEELADMVRYMIEGGLRDADAADRAGQ